MQIHTVTITFGADDGVGFDATIDSFGNQILCAHGYGVDITHTKVDAETERTERLAAKAKRIKARRQP